MRSAWSHLYYNLRYCVAQTITEFVHSEVLYIAYQSNLKRLYCQLHVGTSQSLNTYNITRTIRDTCCAVSYCTYIPELQYLRDCCKILLYDIY